MNPNLRGNRNLEPWNTAKNGVPINQEDMAGTLFLFSVMILEGFQQVGIHVSDHDRECYYSLWRWIGIRLGIKKDYLPLTVFEASLLGHKIGDRCHAVNDDLLKFTDALLAQARSIIPVSLRFESAAVERFSGKGITRSTKLPEPRAFDYFAVWLYGWLFYLIDLVQRKIPFVFSVLYAMKKPLLRLSLWKAQSTISRLVGQEEAQSRRDGGCPFR
jgi:hypothetical protein